MGHFYRVTASQRWLEARRLRSQPDIVPVLLLSRPAMSPVSLALVLVDPGCPGRPDAVAHGVVSSVLAPLASALARHANVRVGLALSAPTAAVLVDDPEDQGILNRLVDASRRGQLELLGGPHWGAPLAQTPWADLQRQLRAQQDWLASHVGTPVRGAWVPLGAWDPLVPRALSPLGLRYAFAPRRLAGASGSPVEDAGPVRVSRDGASVRVLLVDDALSQSATTHPMQLLEDLRIRSTQGSKNHVVAVSLEDLGPERIAALVASLAASTVRSLVPWQMVERSPARATSLLAGVSLEQALWRLPPELAAELKESRSPWVSGPTWDQILTTLPASGRLHAACVRASGRVAAARRLLRARSDARDGAALGDATARLDRALAAGLLEPGPRGHAWNAVARAAAWRDLVAAETCAGKLLGDGRTGVQAGEDDEPVMVRTPDLRAVLDPADGGTLRELHLWGEHPVLNTLERRLPPLWEQTGFPVLVDEEDADDLDTAKVRVDVEVEVELEDDATEEASFFSQQVVADRLPRVAFQDRFFGPQLSLANLARSQPPEIGDFAQGSYRVERADTVGGGVEVVLGREGSVRPAPGVEGLVRLTKVWRFSGHAPLLSVDYQLSNRSREPVQARFGVVLTFNVDGATSASRTLRLGQEPPMSQLSAGEARRVATVVATYADLGFEVVLRTSDPVTALCHPVLSAVADSSRKADWAARPREAFQGVCLALVWPMDLWGEERRRLSVELEARSLGRW